MKIYLDNCCFNRPFDDQSKLRIRLKSEAKLKIQEDIRSGSLSLIWSYIMDYENNKNPFKERQEQIKKWCSYSKEFISENKSVLALAGELNKMGLKKMDSLHIACAIYAKAEYFLSTDDGILKKSSAIQDIKVIDPIEFIKEVLEC